MVRKTRSIAAWLLPACLCLTGCGNAGSVYSRPLPGRNDTQALLDVRDQLKPDDRPAWSAIVMMMENPLSTGVTSRTVGEAVSRYKAQRACMDAHDVSAPGKRLGDGYPVSAYNAEVEAYNRCLKMPV